MKKIYSSFLILSLLPLWLSAQSWQNTYGPEINIDFLGLLNGKIFTNQYVSTDMGANFQPFAGASAFNNIVSHNGLFYGLTSSALFSSQDGLNWSMISGQGGSKIYTDSSHLFISGFGIRASSDNGLTWTTLLDSTIYVKNFLISGTKYIVSTFDGIYTKDVNGGAWDHPTTSDLPAIAACGGNIITQFAGVFRIIDTSSWNMTTYTSGLPVGVDLNIINFQRVGTRLYASTQSGIFYSDSSCSGWQLLIDHPRGTLFISAPYFLIATRVGIEISDDMGSSFTLLNKGISGRGSVTQCAANNNFIYALSNNSLFRKPISNTQWETVDLQNNGCDRVYVYGDTTICFVGNNVWFSFDDGSTWSIHSGGISGVPKSLIKHKNKYFITDGFDLYWSALYPINWHLASGNFYSSQLKANDSILIAECPTGIHISPDAGLTWSQILPGNHSALGVSNTCLLTMANDSLLYSTDFINWIKKESPHFNEADNVIIKDSFAYLSGFNYGYYGSHQNKGLYRLNLSDFTWTQWYSGLTDSLSWPGNSEITCIYENNNIFYASASGRGLYESGNTTLAGINSYSKEPEVLLYPNPAFGTLHLSWKGNKEYQFEIYNTSGILLKEKKNAKGEATITATDFTPGMYFMKLSCGNEVITKKFIIASP